MGLRYGLERLKQLGLSYQEVRLIGGGARSPVWRQMAADIFNLPVVSPTIEEGPAVGAALQAVWCKTRNNVGDLARQYVALDEENRRLPHRHNVSVYDELYALYKNACSSLINSSVFPQHRSFISR